MADFQLRLGRLKQLGAKVIALSAQPKDKAELMVHRHGLTYPVVYGLDPEEMTQKFGCSISLDEPPAIDWLVTTLNCKIDASRRRPAGGEDSPRISRETAAKLIEEFGNNIRGMERHLYDTIHHLNAENELVSEIICESVDKRPQRRRCMTPTDALEHSLDLNAENDLVSEIDERAS